MSGQVELGEKPFLITLATFILLCTLHVRCDNAMKTLMSI